MVWNYNSNYFLDTLQVMDRRHYDFEMVSKHLDYNSNYFLETLLVKDHRHYDFEMVSKHLKL
jgi:hypothetical protein